MIELKEMIKKHQINIAHCATKAGISYSRMAQIIYGMDSPTDNEIKKIEKACGIHIFLNSATQNV